MRAGSLSSPLFFLVMPREGGASSIHRRRDSHDGRGVLDRPVKPDDDSGIIGKCLHPHATTLWVGASAMTHRLNRSKSILPPESTRPTRLPDSLVFSGSAAASAAALAPSAR